MADEKPIRAGQFVKWLSGGPTMYVRNLYEHEGTVLAAMCVWFSGDNHYHAERIPVAELRVVDPNSKGAFAVG